MQRLLAPAFVATVSVLTTGCEKKSVPLEEPSHNPPAMPMPSAAPSARAQVSAAASASAAPPQKR